MLSCLSISVRAFNGELTLKNGDRISGKIIEQGEDAVVVETEYAGRLRIARSHIAAIKNEAAPAATAAGPKVEAAPEKAAKMAEPVLPRRRSSLASAWRRISDGWEGNAHLGFSYTRGNSNNLTMTSGLRAVRVNPQGGMSVYFRSLWNNAHTAGLTTQNAFWGGARYDRNLTRKMFGFLSYDFERDKPRRLSFRSVAGAGAGHRTIKNDRTELEIFAGLGWNRTWQAGADTDTPEGLAGANFKRKINSRMRLQNAFTYFQNVTDRGEYRLIFDTSVNIDVTPRVGVYLAIGNRFNGDPLGNAKRNDFLVTTGLKWNFGKKK